MSNQNFNWEFYVHKYKDLKKGGIDTEEKALEHWKNYGKKEERIFTDIPIFFNWREYLNNYKDLQLTIDTEEKAWQHYIYHGQYEERYKELKERKIKLFHK